MVHPPKRAHIANLVLPKNPTPPSGSEDSSLPSLMSTEANGSQEGKMPRVQVADIHVLKTILKGLSKKTKETTAITREQTEQSLKHTKINPLTTFILIQCGHLQATRWYLLFTGMLQNKIP